MKRRFRKKLEALSVECPEDIMLSSSLRNRYSVRHLPSFPIGPPVYHPPCSRSRATNTLLQQSAVASRIDRAEKAKFLEKFRYTIIASQLLGGHSILGTQHTPSRPGQGSDLAGDDQPLAGSGLVWTVAGAIAIAWAMNWVFSGGFSHLTKKRFLASLVVVALTASVGNAYIRQRWARYVREQALAEVTTFTTTSQDFDSVVSAAVALVQEVELVSRGYRM